MILQTIRKELLKVEGSPYRLGEELGIHRGRIFKVIHEQGDLTTKAADILLKHFGYGLTKRKDGK